MTTAQKTLLAALVLALGGVLYEAHVIRTQQAQLATLARRAGEFAAERDRAREELGATDDALARLDRALADADRLRAELAAQSDPELQAWLTRHRQLRDWAERRPDLVIPEMSLLTKNEWFTAARDADTETEIGARQALNELRQMAKPKVVDRLSTALEGYLAAHHGMLPTTALELAPYFDPPIDAAILSRYKLPYSGAVADVPASGRILEEATTVDGEFDSQIWVQAYEYRPGAFSFGWGKEGKNRNRETAARAVHDFRKANQDQRPTALSQVLPFLADPEDEGVLRKVEELLRDGG